MENPKINLELVREKLAGKAGKQYWRSLDELADTPEFQAWVEDEFPNRSSLMDIDRRSFLKIMGASIALASMAGCRGVFLDQAKIVPYVKAPEELVTGKALFYATAMTLGAYSTGLLAESHEGRPTKLEGNPEHSASLGSTDIFAQASLLDLYDPDRLQIVVEDGALSTWEGFFEQARKLLANPKSRVAILTAPVGSPTVARLLDAFLAKYPGASWFQYEPVNRDSITTWTKEAFGQVLEPVYDFTKAKIVFSLGADFLTSMPGSVRYARDFAAGRRKLKPEEMSRLYVAESTPTATGASADHRFRIRPSESEILAAALLSAVSDKVNGVAPSRRGRPDAASVKGKEVETIAKDLFENKGNSVVIAGDNQSPVVHRIVHEINALLGNFGQSVRYTLPVAHKPVECNTSIKELSARMGKGDFDAVFILGGNPVYDAPADVKFAENLAKVKVRVHHTYAANETSVACDWQLPDTHFLEQWGDGRGYDGTVTLIQPLTAPLFESKSTIEVLSALLGKPVNPMDLVRETIGAAVADDNKWRQALHDGLLAGSAAPAVGAVAQAVGKVNPAKVTNGVEVIFQQDGCLYDGRWANNSWLQELPRTMTKVVWDNVALMSPGFASELKVSHDDLVTITTKAGTVTAPVWVVPGHPERAITLNLGYGRTVVGSVGADKTEAGDVTPVGFNAYVLRTTQNPHFVSDAQVQKAPGSYKVGSTQVHHQMEGRDIVRSSTIEEFLSGHEEHEEHPEADLYPQPVFEYNGPQWGMTIDLTTCIGCNVCAIACQAENNIPSVGKEQVIRGREMHWIRIDRYFVSESTTDKTNSSNYPDNTGLIDNPEVVFQPVACVHCEKAPCEPVCPVAATVHSHEGLNQMVYNRCVGTRYCSNNCPYKVRRFNFLNYTDNQPQFSTQQFPWPRQNKNSGRELLKMINNPDVTVRGRGVMEKCTYCVQRINDARIEAKKMGRDPLDGEIVTACEQACPTQAITFGNIADKTSRVSKLREDKRSYLLLGELNTKPRTSHLIRLRNPNKELA